MLNIPYKIMIVYDVSLLFGLVHYMTMIYCFSSKNKMLLANSE